MCENQKVSKGRDEGEMKDDKWTRKIRVNNNQKARG